VKGRDSARDPEEGGYLETWFAPRISRKMLYYRDLIPEYEHQDSSSHTQQDGPLLQARAPLRPREPEEPCEGVRLLQATWGRPAAGHHDSSKVRFYSVDTVRRSGSSRG